MLVLIQIDRSRGLPAYIKIVEQVQQEGWRGFELSRNEKEAQAEAEVVEQATPIDAHAGVDRRILIV